MKDQGRTDPRTPYAEEYRNRRGFSETIQDHATRIKNVELRANQAPLLGEQAIEVRLNGIPIGTENILDFIEGANVTLTVSDDGQVIHIEIAASGTSSSGYDTIEDEGTPLPQETVLDFQGAGVTATAGAGKTIITIPGGSSVTGTASGGVFAADAVVAPSLSDPDGTPTTLATGEVVLMYATAQAAHDAWMAAALPGAVFRLNRGSAGSLSVDAGFSDNMWLFGESEGGLNDRLSDNATDLGTVTLRNQDAGIIAEHLVIGDLTCADLAADTGMRFKLAHGAINGIVGAFRGDADSLVLDDVYLVSWDVDPAHQASGNVHSRFHAVQINGPFEDGGADAEISGIYSFQSSTFQGGIFFVVGTDKHFALVAECHVYGNMEFQMDGGTLTLDLDAFHLHGGARIVITDLGGGGTVIVNWSGGSVEQTAAPVIEADATVVVTGSIDGVQLLGTPNSPAFKGQFVDFTFGDAISPPSYVVEFL